MGAELISVVLEIKSEVEPNWALAEQHINQLTDLQVVNLYSDVMQLDEGYSEDDEDFADLAKDYRDQFVCALDNCRDGWSFGHRFMNRINLQHSVILLAAGETWGDNIESCDQLVLFHRCGAAKAAGFYG